MWIEKEWESSKCSCELLDTTVCAYCHDHMRCERDDARAERDELWLEVQHLRRLSRGDVI